MKNITVKILLLPPLDGLVSNSTESIVVNKNTTVLEFIRKYSEDNTSLAGHLFKDNHLCDYINIFCNGEQVHADDCNHHKLMQDSEICLLSAIRGG